MKHTLKTSLAIAALLTAYGAPALAGNYAEGDPRPTPLVSSLSRAEVAADAQRWAQAAPTQGYPEGNPREVAMVSAGSRAAVMADTLIWMRSGLAAAQNGEAGSDLSRPAYRQAAAEYARLRSGPEYTALVQSIGSNRASARTASR
jgi:hypothetical protein